jgi:serine/threonine-protein kinase
MAIQMCGALKAAHDAGVIHRDLKPSNLLIAANGQVKLTDFGVAQVFATAKLTVTGGVIGTAEYMSPEQSQGQRATKRSDLYSLGAVLYVMLTGRPPFTGTTTVEIMHKQRFARFDRPKLYVPDIPSWLDDLVSQLLEKNPDDRPPDAYVTSRKLQEILAKANLSAKDDAATVVEGHLTIDDTTPSAQLGDRGVGATLMRDLVREEIDRQQKPGPIQAVFNNIWVLVTLLALLIGGAFWWSRPKSLTPEERYQAGIKLLQQPAGPKWLEAKERYLTPLVEADPQRWSEAVQPFLDQIEAYELETEQAPPRRRGRIRSARSEPERMLALIRSDWERGDVAAADAKLTALATLVAADPEAGPMRAVVASWRSALAELQETLPDRRAFVERALDRAESLRETEPSSARALGRSLLLLYGEDSSVSDLMERARMLANVPNAATLP